MLSNLTSSPVVQSLQHRKLSRRSAGGTDSHDYDIDDDGDRSRTHRQLAGVCEEGKFADRNSASAFVCAVSPGAKERQESSSRFPSSTDPQMNRQSDSPRSPMQRHTGMTARKKVSIHSFALSSSFAFHSKLAARMHERRLWRLSVSSPELCAV